MTIVPYEHDKHYALVASWLWKRGFSIPEKQYFPEIGFIVSNVAVGFLSLSGTRMAQIENVATDPDAPKRARAQALKVLCEYLEGIAFEEGMEFMSLYTQVESFADKVKEMGYLAEPNFTLLYKPIGEKH